MFICTHILARKNAHRQQFKSSCLRQSANVLYIDCARAETKQNLGTGDGEVEIKDPGLQETGVTDSLDIHPMRVNRSFRLVPLPTPSPRALSEGKTKMPGVNFTFLTPISRQDSNSIQIAKGALTRVGQ